MPIEETANFWRIRITDPKKYKSFRTKARSKYVKIVLGIYIKKGKRVSEVQSLLYDKRLYTKNTAKNAALAYRGARVAKHRKQQRITNSKWNPFLS